MLSHFARLCLALSLAGLFLAAAAPSRAWNAHGHRTITYLALDGLPADMPAWLRESAYANMIAEQSTEPDKWRATRTPPMGHENSPDHYLDVEDLAQFGLSLETLPPMRYDYVRAMAIAKHEHPDRIAPYDAARDRDRSREWPGFVAHAITEHYAKLQSGFNTLRLLEASPSADPAHAYRITLARSNVIYHMGVLSHFVGDTAQPLHTTRHHHGWVGENPRGYTTEYGFHSYIDGTVLEIHRLDFDSLRPGMDYTRTVRRDDPWADTLAHVRRSFEAVEPLYALQKDGSLEREPGKEFISARLRDGASMLSAMYAAAWRAAEPTDEQMTAFLRYNSVDPARLPVLAPAPR